jgi:alkylation response protein AidB-like acyl-CoA dehydrogenase
MDFDLTEDQTAFITTARAFAEKELMPHAAEWDHNEHFPKDVIQRAAELGFCSLYTPEDVGGLELSRLDASLIVEELARGCTSTAAYITIHNMALWIIATYGNGIIKEKYCEQLVSGECLASYCLTEPGSGSDAASLKTSAHKTEDSYILNGNKAFISGAGDTDILVVMARLKDDQGIHQGAKGISSFIVPADTSGIKFGKKESKMGWNSQPTRQVSFDNATIPHENLLGHEGEGFKIAMKALDGGRINIATCSIGTAQAALDQSVNYVQQRKQFGKAIAEFQSCQFRLADMITELVAARNMVRLAAWKLDNNDPVASTYCAMAKRFATDVGFSICNEALQLHGGYGYLKDFPLERHVRDSRVHQILEGTNEIMKVIISRHLFMDNALEAIK